MCVSGCETSQRDMASSCITSKQRAAKEVETLMESIFETTPWWSNDVLQPYLDNLTVKVQERKDALQTQREATVQRDEKKAECLETEVAAERVLADLREKREVVQSERQQLANITRQLEEVKQKLEEVNGERHKLEERNNTEEEMEKTAQHKYIAQLYSKITEMRLDNTAPEGSIRGFMFGAKEVRHFVVEREQETLEHATTRLWDLLQEMESQKAPIQINNAVESLCHGDTKT